MELLTTILTNLPIVELLSHGVQTDTTGFLYDIAQAVAGLHLAAKGFDQLSEATPWTWDDGPAKALLGYTTSATAWLANLMGANNKNKKR